MNSVHSTINSEAIAFDNYFLRIVDDVADICKNQPELQPCATWFKRVVQYNVPFGKKNRGLTVVAAYRSLTDKQEHNLENIDMARFLGWLVEILQAFFLIADDMMDDSLYRRGKPCWYRVKDVGLIAINDAVFLNSLIYLLLKKYVKDHPSYLKIVELFHEITMNTIMGQSLDLQTATQRRDFSQFTQERYMAIVRWKTAYYSFYLPVALAMYLAGVYDDESHANAKDILLHMGTYFQIQDDYLDCYGVPEITGKVGTDIQDFKCSWLVIQALQSANDEQRAILLENYGYTDSEKVARIKKLFDELQLPAIYRKYEDDSYTKLIQLIEEKHGTLPKIMFTDYARKIYQREA